ncbi:chemotaxis protein CheX [bacterium]|nr:chemotaxis protein CheX [bacterium]MBU1637800.1 chemotaxis protein CheX [bacterium]
MNREVALVGFPRLQEQIATRMLAEHELNATHLTQEEAEKQVSKYGLLFFFWPDSGEHKHHFKALQSSSNGSSPPVLIVASAAGKRSAMSVLPDIQDSILSTPLQPHDLSAKLSHFIKVEKPAASVALNADFINPFVEGTVATLKQMAEMVCVRTNLSLSEDAKTSGDISGTIGLSGEAEGFVSVSFRLDLAQKIVGKMLMLEDGEAASEDDMRDGVGEFMNMVAGYAKAQLANTEHSFMLSIPNVISGGPHSVGQPRGLSLFVIDFETDGSEFHVIVCLVPKKK